MAAEEHRQAAADKDMRLETRIQPGITAEIDETLYIRMLTNLLSNAVGYGRRGGIISVELYAAEDTAVGTVRDDGNGISAKDLPHIFERFYRADASRSDSEHSGLGLSMVKWILDAHGGSIEAESVPGQGSAFTFRLPLHQTEKKSF